jgi:hypothetical protein
MTRKARHLELVTADGKTVQGTCHHSTKDLPRVDGMDPDALERLFLRLLRCICASLATGKTHGWEVAHEVAEAKLGLADGPALVAQIVALLRAIRTERRAGFAFMAADCPKCSQRISEEEKLAVHLLRAARSNNLPALPRLAGALALAGAAPNIVLAAQALGQRLDAYAIALDLRARPVPAVPS